MAARSLELRSFFGIGRNDYGIKAIAQEEEATTQAEISIRFLLGEYI